MSDYQDIKIKACANKILFGPNKKRFSVHMGLRYALMFLQNKGSGSYDRISLLHVVSRVPEVFSCQSILLQGGNMNSIMTINPTQLL
jgi:hypothetical protein